MAQPTYTDEDLKRVAGIKDEIFNDQLQIVLEVVTDIQTQVSKITKIEEDVDELKQDMKVVKAAVTDTSRELHALDQRVGRLEAKAA